MRPGMGKIISDEIVPARQPWGTVIAAGDTLTIIDLEGQQAVDFLCYDAANREDRYSATNTLKVAGQHFRGQGHCALRRQWCGAHDSD